MLDDIFNDIEQWHKLRQLYSPDAQMTKVVEEIGELAHAISHNSKNLSEYKDAIGDSLIALIGMAYTLNLNAADCLMDAWEEVQHRTGKTIGGHFIKDKVE